MDIVLSWSGSKSRALAAFLYEWIPEVLPNVTVWMSDEDISKGKPWFAKLMQTLASAKACIICITPDNVGAPWLYFEAGAVASKQEESHIFTYLVSVDTSDIDKTPLAQYQCTMGDKEDTWRLIKDLNTALGEHNHNERLLRKAFESEWPALSGQIEVLGKQLTQRRAVSESDITVIDYRPTHEEVQILLKASATDNGRVFAESSEAGLSIHIGGETINDMSDGRAARRWEEAIERLTGLDLLRSDGIDGLYKLTSKGYDASDQIKLVTASPTDNRELEELEALMPELFAEMREDYQKNPLTREFVLLDSNGNIYNGSGVFIYYRETHSDLENKMRILENHGLVVETTFNNTTRYRVSEKLVTYLLKGARKEAP